MPTQNKTTENKTGVKDFLNTVADEAKRKDCFRIAEIFEKESGYEAKMWGTAIVESLYVCNLKKKSLILPV